MTERGWNHYRAVLTSTVGSEVSGPTSGYKDECVSLARHDSYVTVGASY